MKSLKSGVHFILNSTSQFSTSVIHFINYHVANGYCIGRCSLEKDQTQRVEPWETSAFRRQEEEKEPLKEETEVEGEQDSAMCQNLKEFYLEKCGGGWGGQVGASHALFLQ